MNVRHFRVTALACLISACAGIQAVSAGQAPDTPPPGTVMLGPIRITPSLILKDMGMDDNVFNEAENPKRDFTFTVAPRADISLRMRRLRLGFTTTTDYVYYRTYRSERGTNASSSARVDFDLGILRPYATIQGLNSRARINQEIDARARHRDLLYGGGIALKVASRTNLLLNVTRSTISYDTDAEFRGVDLRQSLDGRRRSVDAGIAIALTPLTTFSTVIARETQSFNLSPDRDSTSWRVTPGFTFSPSGLLTGAASVGYRRFHTISPALPDYSGLVSTVNVRATIYGRNLVHGLFTRDVQYSYELDTAYYVGTGGTLTWTFAVVGPIDVRGTVGRYGMDYRSGGERAGRDHTTTYGGGVGYRFSSSARIGLNAEWSRRQSNRSAERGYRNHRVFAGLTWGIAS
jgi:hypothetical protein